MTWTCRKDGKERKKISSLSYRRMIPRAMLSYARLSASARLGNEGVKPELSFLIWYRVLQSRQVIIFILVLSAKHEVSYLFSALSLTASLDICCANWQRADTASGEVSKLDEGFPPVDDFKKK